MTVYPMDETLPPSTRMISPWLIRIPLLMILGAVLLCLILISLVLAFQVTYAQKITPGVSAFGMDLGGMTQAEAAAAIADQFDGIESMILTLRDGERFWQMTAEELGLALDTQATIAQAKTVGTGDNVLRNLAQQAQVWFEGETIVPILRYDQGLAVARLTEIAGEVNQPAQDAMLVMDGLTVSTTAGQEGRTLDVMATLAAVDQALLNPGIFTEIPLVMQESMPRIWNADEAAGDIRAALSGPVALTAEGADGQPLGPWQIDATQIAALLDVQLVDYGDGSAGYAVGIDMGVFADYLDTLAPGLLMLPHDGRFRFNVNNKQLEVIQPSVDGRQLDVEATLRRLEDAVFRYDARAVPIAFNYVKPRYHDGVTGAELGITELVAEATTYYTGSTVNRRHNIAEGASRFDGVIIAPGEEFSFNYWLGEISEESGFVEGKVIVGGRTVAGVGGGICQVSTTAFRAALQGGFTIIERNSHAYRVGYYELNGVQPGLDAAIWSPERDFRFQNDTPYHLLVETSVYPANNALQFRFYSTNPGRVVEILTPEVRNTVPAKPTVYEANRDLQPGQIVQVDYAAEGADVTVTRIVRDLNGNEIKRDTVYTHYLPWQAVYQVAPGDARLSS